MDGDRGTTDVAMAESAEVAMEKEAGGVMCVGELTVRLLSWSSTVVSGWPNTKLLPGKRRQWDVRF